MSVSIDTVVVGGGAMGSSTAWHLARKGHSIALLERFGNKHKFGASHGTSRNYNVLYAEPSHLRMVLESGRWIRKLEEDSGVKLLDVVGILTHGASVPNDSAIEYYRKNGVRAQMLSVDEATERWVGINFDNRVLFSPDGGRLNLEATVEALHIETERLGGQVKLNCPVRKISILRDDLVEIATDDATYRARRAVITLGAWTTKMLDGVIAVPNLVVTQEQPAHFAVRDTSAVWPSFMHSAVLDDLRYEYWCSDIYGMYTPNEGIKVGWHGVGPATDPDARTYVPVPEQLTALRRYIEEWVPGADPNHFVPISCTYTTSADTHFILDRIGPLVIGAGFSGMGAKFTGVVGRILANLVNDDKAAFPMFSLARF